MTNGYQISSISVNQSNNIKEYYNNIFPFKASHNSYIFPHIIGFMQRLNILKYSVLIYWYNNANKVIYTLYDSYYTFILLKYILPN